VANDDLSVGGVSVGSEAERRVQPRPLAQSTDAGSPGEHDTRNGREEKEKRSSSESGPGERTVREDGGPEKDGGPEEDGPHHRVDSLA